MQNQISYTFLNHLVLVASIFMASEAFTATAVDQAFVESQIKQTRVENLGKSGKIVFREIPGSDIVELNVAFNTGLQDLSLEQKVALEIGAAAAPFGGKGYPKEILMKLYSKYSLGVNCMATHVSYVCSLSTLTEYLRESLPAFAAIILNPTFDTKDLEIARSRLLAKAKQTIEQPTSYSNDVINKIFYPLNHPYRKLAEDEIKILETIPLKKVSEIVGSLISGDNIILSVASSLQPEKLKSDLSRYFGKLPIKKTPQQSPADPAFDPNNSYIFEDRDIPTAFIRIKFNAPRIQDKESNLNAFAMHILDQNLDEELRTKRSLTYGVNAGIISGDIGIGYIVVTTSKPKESLEAIQDVITKLKKSSLKKQDIDDYKNEFTTSYLLNLESHASQAEGLLSSLIYFGSIDRFFKVPLEIASFTPEQVQKALQNTLVNFRMGILYNRNNFKDDWAKKLIQFSQKN